MLKTNRLNCTLTDEISKPTNTDVGLRTVFNTKSEDKKAECAVKKFAGNCMFPNASLKETETESDSDEH